MMHNEWIGLELVYEPISDPFVTYLAFKDGGGCFVQKHQSPLYSQLPVAEVSFNAQGQTPMQGLLEKSNGFW